MLCGAAGGKVRGQTAGDCGGSHVHIPKYNCGVELVPRVLVDDVSSFPVVWGEDLGSNLQKNFRAA